MNKRNFIKTGLLAPLGALVPVGLLASNQKAANEVILRPYQQEVFDIYKNTDQNIFCLWGEGTGKTFLFNYIMDSIPGIKAFIRNCKKKSDPINYGCHDGVLIVDYVKPGIEFLKYHRDCRRKIFFVTPQDSEHDMFSIVSKGNKPFFSYYIPK
jgi:hypothetical protein